MVARTLFYFLLCLTMLAPIGRATAGDLPEGVDDEWLAQVEAYIASPTGDATKDWAPEPANWTALGDRDNAGFGFRLAPAGDVNGDGYSDIIVGSPYFAVSADNEPGRAWVFLGTADGLESIPRWWTTGGADGDLYGFAVACAGDVDGDGYDDILVGAPFEGNGRVHCFHGSAGGLSLTADWDYTSSDEYAWFGYSLSTAGDRNADGYDDILIGSPRQTSGNGAVWIFEGSSNGLGNYDVWYGGRTGALFGASVSTAGDINGDGLPDWVAGAPLDATGGFDAGALRVACSGEYPVWIDGDVAGRGLGRKVSLAGDVNGDGYADVLVGTQDPGYSGSPAAEARLYLGGSDGLSTSPTWWRVDSEQTTTAPNVTTAGDVNGDGYADILVGYELVDTGAGDSGEVLLYLGYENGVRLGASWSTTHFGARRGVVATAGDVDGDGYSDILVGAWNWSEDFDSNGKVDCYHGRAEALSDESTNRRESDQANAWFGASIAAAGDVNGDGFGDILVGAPNAADGEFYEGMAYLFHGTATGIEVSPSWTGQSDQTTAFFGRSVAAAGDVNGDGYADIMVGADQYAETFPDEGAVFLWLGRSSGIPDGTPANADWAFYGGQANARLGYSLASAGDVNGDGWSDLVVGAPYYDAGTTDEGAVFGFHGSPTGLPATHDWFHDTAKAECMYGCSVSSAGDFNGDGYSDVIVGARDYASPAEAEGLVFVYTGSADGLQTGAPWWHGEGDQVGAEFGYSVASAGDVNGDGYSDIIVGAPYRDSSATDSGMCFAWYGGPTPPASDSADDADWVIGYIAADSELGFSVASAGDLDNDGYSDVVVGAPSGYGYEDDSGLVMVFSGSESGLETAFTDFLAGDQEGARFGREVAPAGDVDGDGYPDLIISAPAYDHGETNEGLVYRYSGGGGDGLLRAPRQMMSDNTTPLCPLNRSDSLNAFGLHLTARSAAGRELLRLECEVREVGTAFTGANHGPGSWVDTGAPTSGGSSVEVGRLIAGLNSGEHYRWRMRTVSRNPYFPNSPWFTLAANGPGEADMYVATSIAAVEGGPVPEAPRDITCYPNPFNPQTTIAFDLAADGPVEIAVYDLSGARVRLLVSETRAAGHHTAVWDGRNESGARVASGVYLASLRTETTRQMAKVVLVK